MRSRAGLEEDVGGRFKGLAVGSGLGDLVLGLQVGVVRHHGGDALDGLARAFEIGTALALSQEEQAVEEDGERIHVVAIGAELGGQLILDLGQRSGGLRVLLGLFDVVARGGTILAGAVLLGGLRILLRGFEALRIFGDGILLALQGAVQLDAGIVALAECEVVEGLVGVHHHLVIRVAAIWQGGLVGEQRAGFGSDLHLGLLFPVIDLFLGKIQCRQALLGQHCRAGRRLLAIGSTHRRSGADGGGQVGERRSPEDRALFQFPDERIAAVGTVRGFFVHFINRDLELAGAPGFGHVSGLLGVVLAAAQKERAHGARRQ